MGPIRGASYPEHRIVAGGYSWFANSMSGTLEAGKSSRGRLRILSVGRESEFSAGATGWNAEFTSGNLTLTVDRVAGICE